MLHPVSSSRKQGTTHPQNPVGGIAPPRRPASANPPPTAGSTQFDDLPNELVCNVAKLIFTAAVGDPKYDVESLACNKRLRSTLSAELQANNVLRDIHAAHSFADLGTALQGVRNLFPPYQQGCLIAAIRLLPRLGSADRVPEPLWSQIRALLPHSSIENSDGTSGRDTVLLALVEAIRSMPPVRNGALCLENVLAAMDPQAPLSPPLEAALIRWTKDRLRNAGTDPDDAGPLRDRLMRAAPMALRTRIQGLFDFIEKSRTDNQKFSVATMTRQISELDDARAAGHPDRRWRLHQLSRAWRIHTWRSTECETLYRSFFSRLEPAEQVWLIGIGHSPLKPREIAPFLNQQVGRFPGATLLDAMAQTDIIGLGDMNWDPRAALVQDIVSTAMNTPQGASVLQAAINYESVHYLGLRPFLERCIAASDPERRLALNLRVDLAQVGCGEYDRRLALGRAEVSARIDAVLDDNRQVPLHAIETIVDMNISWLNVGQTTRLVERIRQLPPANRARCLVEVFSKLYGVRSGDELPPAHLLLDACRSLPAELRAGPLSALLDSLRNPHVRACRPLLDGITQLYDTLPPALRPVSSSQHAHAMRQSRDQALGQGLTPPGAAALRRR